MAGQTFLRFCGGIGLALAKCEDSGSLGSPLLDVELSLAVTGFAPQRVSRAVTDFRVGMDGLRITVEMIRMTHLAGLCIAPDLGATKIRGRGDPADQDRDRPQDKPTENSLHLALLLCPAPRAPSHPYCPGNATPGLRKGMSCWRKGADCHQNVTLVNNLPTTFHQAICQAVEYILPAEQGEYKGKKTEKNRKNRTDLSYKLKNLPFRRFRFPQQPSQDKLEKVVNPSLLQKCRSDGFTNGRSRSSAPVSVD
jgi:hypothetical protein